MCIHVYRNADEIIKLYVVWDSTEVKSPSTFEQSPAVNFQMSRSIDDNKPATQEVTFKPV